MKKKLWGLLIGSVLTVFFIFPLIINFSTHLSSRQDGLLIAWIINQNSQSLLTGKNLFDLPFFYPYQNTIGYSDLFLPTALFNIPVKLFLEYLFQFNFLKQFTNINSLNILIMEHNFHLFFGSILVFWGQYLLGLYLFKSKKLAILSGVIFAFSNLHLDYMAHLHTFLIAGIPFFFLFFFKFIKTKNNKYLLLANLAILYQLLNSPMSGLFLIVMSLLLLFDQKIRQTLWQQKKLIGLYFVTSLVLIAFFFQPYFLVSKQFNYSRTIRDSAHFSFSINKLFHPEIILYSLIIIYLSLKTNLKKIKTLPYFYLFFTFLILGGLLMLGPVLKVNEQTFKIFNLPIPLPYTIFYYLFPGFKAFRASSRWIIVFLFGISIVIPYLIKNVKSNKITNQNNITYLLLFLINPTLLYLQLTKIKIFKINTKIPQIYKTIKNRPENNLAEFPTYVWSQTDNYYHEADRLLYQSFHHKNLYNGFSGFIPPEREFLWHTISNNLEDEKVIKHLKESKIELILLHTKENIDYLEFSSPHYELITCQDNDCLYRLK